MLDGSQDVAAKDFDVNVRSIDVAPPTAAWLRRHADNRHLRRLHAGCGCNGVDEASMYAAHIGIKVCHRAVDCHRGGDAFGVCTRVAGVASAS
jgi:hypothetical protein